MDAPHKPTRVFRFEPKPEPAPAPLPAPRPNDGYWVPACNRTEVPFWTRRGRKVLYCWNPTTREHAYLDCGTDMILSPEEARLEGL
jgi:hypothetical protein